MGQGYTRQSSAAIADGETINALDHNKEFNQIQAAFNSTTGHAHDGTTGNGPKISLLSSVTGTLQPENGGLGGIHKLDATTAPSVTDDENDGYTEGSMWIDVTNKIFYICVDATATAAVWRRFEPQDAGLTSIAGLTTTADRMIYTTASDVYAVTPLTSFGRSFLDDADASTALSTLGMSTYIKTLIDDTDAATARGTLGLGTIATQAANNVSITGGSISGASLTASSVNITGGSVTGITDLAIADGGTGASDATTARSNLGLGNVDNTSDADKPVSTATQTALNLKANLASPALTGTPTAPTASSTTNTTQIATTAFVQSIRESLWPVGSIYTNAGVSTNPATLLGFGTWTAFAAGRMLVGFDSGDPLFNTVEETGGSKDAIVVAHTHTGSTNTTGAHTHTFWVGQTPGSSTSFDTDSSANGDLGDQKTTSSNGNHSHTFTTDSTGSSGTNANLPPYITVYMWKRTA